MTKRLAILTLALASPTLAEEPEDIASDAAADSAFVGRYDGSGFEMAMGMEIRADGTFGWGLSVGALDMRANGTWRQDGNFITLTSDPKPVAPEFRWSGIESVTSDPAKAPFVRVVWASNGKDFPYADVQLTCANGKRFYGQVHADGYPSNEAFEYADELPAAERDPRQSCDVPDTAVLIQGIHDIRSKPFKLADFGWKPGQTVRFAFHRNDLGVADFTGVTGYLDDGKIVLDVSAVGRDDFSGPLEMRRLPEASD
ncbi:MAG: hypothetical protein AAGK01_10800 [Pseudomonadota bacterium]